ncbi:hypothetical protein Tcan_02342 [Toxocara canis]|uniref:EB domain-containing protein n=1 Tax=Toxocara canis TaxID=6265 RepID=A0A0B2UQ52_TOXCA|nr:hypothetical protein Tcan_02342 [Toxocara canis]
MVMVRAGDSCRNGETCTGESNCVKGICVCSPLETIINGRCTIKTKPVTYADPGESCGRGEHCQGESICNRNTWKCMCPLEMIKIGKKCQPRLKSAPGFPCGNGEVFVDFFFIPNYD